MGVLRRLLLWQVRKVEIQSRADKDEVPRFLTTTCLVFSTSEKSKCSKQTSSNSLHLNIYTFYTVVYLHVYLLSPLKPQERTRKCVVLVSDFIQRLRIKCRCLTKKSF